MASRKLLALSVISIWVGVTQAIAGDSAVLYTSPTGRSGGMGTRSDPLDLATGLARVGPTTVLELLGGVYHVSNSARLTLGGRGDGQNIIRAASGERPIVTKNNGYPPTVFVNNKTRVEGIWFGGTTDTTNMPFIVNNDDEIVGCVFWGYYGCINDASKHNLFEDNLFVNCGRGDYYHAIYISGLSPSWDSCTTVRRNIFIGGEGYAIQLWHTPTYVKVQNNFVADAMYGFASDGVPVIANDNILWSNRESPTVLFQGSIVVTHNLIGKNHTHYVTNDPNMISMTADANSFIEPAAPGGPFGTNATRWDESQSFSKLNVQAAQIDSAVEGIKSGFAHNVATIMSDTNLPSKIGVLQLAIDIWGGLRQKSESGVATDRESIPTQVALHQNYPNPFNPSTTFEFFLSSSGAATVKVFNLLGEEVATLVSENLQAGRHSAIWNATALPSGVYICRLQSGGHSQSVRSLLVK